MVDTLAPIPKAARSLVRERLDAAKSLKSDSFREEIRAQIKRDIQSGIVDSQKIRSNVRSFVRQKMNENIIGKVIPKEKRSVGGFIKNAKEDLGEIIHGFGALLGMGFKAVLNPKKAIETGADTTKKLITSPQYRSEWKQRWVDPIIDEYKEYRHPLTKLYEDPVDVFLDITALLSLGGTAVAKAGAKTTGAAIRKAATPITLKNISSSTKFVMRKLPGGEDIVKNMELAAGVRKQISKSQLQFLNIRNKTILEINNRVKKLTKEEIQALPLAAEGFIRPPVKASKEFYEALGLVRSMSKDQERFGLSLGKLTPEIIERRKFQPLAKFLEKEGKIKAPKGIPFEQLTGTQLNAYIGKIKKVFPEADPIYMRHFFEDNPKRFSQFFLNTAPVRKTSPGFLKKSYGKEGYIGSKESNITKAQLSDVLVRQSVENLKWQKNIKLIEDIKKHPAVLPLKAGAKPLPGYRVFAPNGMIRFYKGTIDLTKELKKKANVSDDALEIFQDAAEALGKKEFVGVTSKVKLFQVPEAMSAELSKLVASSNPYIKLFWDKPLDAFRFSVLSLYPRWNLNNVVGNAIFSTISGDVFNPKAFYMYRQAKQSGMFPDELFGGVHQVERTTSGRLGGTIDKIPLVKSTVALHDKLMETKNIGFMVKNAEKTVNFTVFKPIKAIGNLGFKLNFAVDDMFKGVAFINRALKADRKGFMKRMLTSFDDSMKILDDLKKKPAKMEAIVDDVHNWYYHGLNLTDFERRAVRRVIPFYSWMRWISLYSFRVTTEAPIRANILANFSRDFYTFTGQNKLPESLKGAIPIGNDEDGTVYYLRTSGLNPFSTLNELMSEGVLGTALSAAAPGIKVAAEQWKGETSFLGIPFTKKDIHRAINGRLFKFDPEVGKVVEVSEKVKPNLIENILRNYIPQYLLMETLLTKGKKRYTSEGLITILSDLFKDPADRKSVVQDVITLQEEERTTPAIEIAKALGISIKPVEPKTEKARQEALQAATTAIKNKELPILNPNFKKLLREKITQELVGGTPPEELKEKVKIWIGINIEKLKKLK